ncbi:dephospho-CoA kinase [Limisalsivibrio acetivorans]|uniref:dephospho-CoA kinase n=1 Tax=Limisalsivibrio acetivorans TaxID=1304888 RepID=UPI0003B39878|nr:dephospho-CoA kinase [Limisalsivibrio acetivorans]
MYLGLTGNIATGKSTVAKMFEELGCYSIDADAISREVMAKDGRAYAGVVEEFGSEILDENGEIDRAALKGIVFGNEKRRLALEKIVHPHILRREDELVGEIKGKDDKAFIITQAALSVEKGTYKRFDALIVVYSDPVTQLERLSERDGINEREALRIMASQMPMSDKIRYADYIINNSGTLDETREDVNRVYTLLRMMEKAVNRIKRDNPEAV